MTQINSAQELLNCFLASPHPSLKVTNYFQIYADLFTHLRGSSCTFIETGVLNGGSLFMWRAWLGEKARIIGLDMNPEAKKWEEHGFEIHIGDQGNPEFWRETLAKTGPFDVLLDDGGHQSFQQIVTLTESIQSSKERGLIVIEDTCSSFMREFAAHRHHSFLEFAKASTDTLIAKTNPWPNEFPMICNSECMDLFSSVYSIQFFSGIVVFKIDPRSEEKAQNIWNRLPQNSASDFRYNGVSSAVVSWPDPFTQTSIVVKGGER